MASLTPVSPIAYRPFLPQPPTSALPAARALATPTPFPAPAPTPTPTPSLAGRSGNGSTLGAGQDSESMMAIFDTLAETAQRGMDVASAMVPLQRPGGGLDIAALSRMSQMNLRSDYLGVMEKGFGLGEAVTSDSPVSETTKWGLSAWLGDVASDAATNALKAGQSMLEAGTRLSRFKVVAGAAAAETAVISAVENVVDGFVATPTDLVKPTDSFNDALIRSNRYRMQKFQDEWAQASWYEKPLVPITNMFEGIGMDLKTAGTWVANTISSWF